MPTNRRANGFRPSLSIWRVAACAFCLLGLYLTPAAAADVPKLNVEPLCHGIADQGDPLERLVIPPCHSSNAWIPSRLIKRSWSKSGQHFQRATDRTALTRRELAGSQVIPIF